MSSPGAVSDEHERDTSRGNTSSSRGSAVSLSWEAAKVVAEPATKPSPPAKEREAAAWSGSGMTP